MTTTNTQIADAAATLVARLREWAAAEKPMIGHASADESVRLLAARKYQSDAAKIADRIALMTEDEMEAYFVGYDLRNETVNMDAHDLIGVGDAYQAAFDAAIARRDEREGFRRDERGFRQQRNAAGEWVNY